MVLAPSNGEGRIDLGKALSRREVKAAAERTEEAPQFGANDFVQV